MHLLALGASVYGAVTGKRGWGLPWALAWDLLLLAVYYGGMLGMYLYLMPEEEALRLAGFERYACSGMTLYAGILLLQAVADLEGSFTVDIDLRGAYRAYAPRRPSAGISTQCWGPSCWGSISCIPSITG